MSEYPIATICGSMMFMSQMLMVADELTRQGNIVLMPLTRKSSGNSVAVKRRIEEFGKRCGKVFDPEGRHLNSTPITGEELDRMHRAKIDMADRVVFVTEFASYMDHFPYLKKDPPHESVWTGYYFGESTRNELAYARSLDKPISFARTERRDYRDRITWLEIPS